MNIIDFMELELQYLITHRIGNKLRDEKFLLSSEISEIEEKTLNFLLKYFILPIRTDEVYSFSHSVKLDMNEVYSLVKKFFEAPQASFIDASQNIAKLLYEQSMHPKIKEGELNIAYFTNVQIEGKIVDAFGIFKSENNIPFIKMNGGKNRYQINHDYGFEIKGIDKGCIILNVDSNNGYKILIADNGNKTTDVQYWKDDFLKIYPINDEYHQTKEILNIAKNFVTKRIDDDFEVNKADKIDLLNRSVEYFKKRETFDKNEFEQEVFQNKDLINSFREFDKNFRKYNKIELSDNFEISSQAVKKQARVLKSVLKLDKNFHIYIHGNRDLIEQGTDENGRKYYKIYYQEES
jgi:hypothetical protein